MNFTYEVARKAAIIFRTSVSLRTVSSNPGVSISTTRRWSRLKEPAICTAPVQDRSPFPTPRSDPLMRLMNCVIHGQAYDEHPANRGDDDEGKRPTVDFPVPVAPITLSDKGDSHIIANSHWEQDQLRAQVRWAREARVRNLRNGHLWQVRFLQKACEPRWLSSISVGELLPLDIEFRRWLRSALTFRLIPLVGQPQDAEKAYHRHPSRSMSCLQWSDE